MNYHLSCEGLDKGIFPLDELQRRRMVGELSGNELVWREGMPQWQTLDSVLQALPPVLSPAPPAKSHKGLIVGLVAAACAVFVLGLVAMGAVAYYVVHTGAAGRSETSSEPDLTPSAAADAATKAVSTKSTTETAATVMERRRAFRIRQYVEGYEKRGERNPECDKLAAGFLSNWIACNYNGTVNTNLPSLTELGSQLANDPHCTDPIVLTASGITSPNLFEAIHRLERASKNFETSKHLGYPKFYATVLLAEKISQSQRQHYRVGGLDEKALQYLNDAFSDGSIRPEDQDDIAENLVLGWGCNFLKRNAGSIHSILKAQNKDFQWLALVVDGESEINAAWQARGSGYATAVTDAGWKGFNENLALARDHLTQAWKLRPDLPLAPSRMITVALGDADIEEMRTWFDRTVDAQIDYANAWHEMRWGLRPRWHGDLDSMLAFGVTAVNTRRFDTDVPRMFFDSVADIEQEQGMAAGQHIYGRDDIWPHFQEMYEGYISNPSQTEYSRDGWRSTYAVIAYLAGKYDVAATQLRKLNWKPHETNLNGYGRDLSLMAFEVAARTGKQSQKVETAENFWRRGDVSPALKTYEELAATKDLDVPTQTFARERRATLNFEQRLRGGGWIPFLPADTDFTGWQVNLGKCKLLPDGALEVEADENGHLLYSRLPIGTEFEMRGQFEIVSSTSQSFQAGIAMGVPQFENYNWYGFRIKRNQEEGDVACFSQQWTTTQITSSLSNLDSRTNSFDFWFSKGRISATLNGVPIFENVRPPQHSYVSTNEFLVGLGAFSSANSTVIRYRNVELKRLTE